MGKFIITEEDKKHIKGLYESSMFNLPKPQGNEPKKFKIGSDVYQVQNITTGNNGWAKLDYVKVLPNGMVEKKLNVGYLSPSNPKFIYQSLNVNSPKIGPIDFNLSPTTSQPQITQRQIEYLENFTENLTNYLGDTSGEYEVIPLNSIENNQTKFGIGSTENESEGTVILSFEEGRIKVIFDGSLIYETTLSDTQVIELTSRAIVSELMKQVYSSIR